MPHGFARSTLLTLLTAAALSSCSSTPRHEIGVGFDDQSEQILVTFGRGLEGGETLHSRIRRGQIGDLDCGSQLPAISRIDGAPHETEARTWRGALTEPSMFEELYDDSWLESEPTPEMLEQAALGGFFIDVCLMNGSSVVRERSFDIRRALDQAGTSGKFDGEDEERIESTVAYAEACVAELGEIPFFEKLGEGDYATFNCLDATPIPTTVTDSDGNVTRPDKEVDQCDEAQYIYSLCEPNAVSGETNGPRVVSRSNDEGTSWTLLCRKARTEEGAYNDIAMIGTNPFTGRTCFFQNALYSRTDGLHVPHPGDKIESETSSQQSETLWNGIHGGIGSGIQCAKCHSTDALIHTPWIDGALNGDGDPVIPKMGVHDDFVLGFNDAPYSLINAAGQGWSMPKHLVSSEADACTRCHRIGDGRWSSDWIDRLVGEDDAWVNLTTPAYRSFEHTFWMPPGLDGIEEATWDASEFGKAVKFIQGCAREPENCEFAALPTDPLGEVGDLPEIDLEGTALATESGKILGASVSDPSCPGGDCRTRRCAECHSMSKTALFRWSDLTNAAWNECNLQTPASEMNQEEALKAVNCLRVDPADPTSVFEAAKLGILTTGVQYTDFRRLFQQAYGASWSREYTRFIARVGMPKGNHPKLSQREYATLLKWFGNDLNDIDVIETPPPPATCEERWNDAAITSHLFDMQFDGWAAQNREAGIRMHGCAPGADPSTCFASASERTMTWGNDSGTVREVTRLGFNTSFWTRSSADGRYVGNGGGAFGSTITDLQTGKDIGVDAAYDPGFFPDNSGFIFQGAVGGAGICAQSVLASDDVIDFTETGCMNAVGVNLYQHVARGPLGGDYFIINSQFVSDSGMSSSDPPAFFDADATMKFTPMIFNGTTYEQMEQVIVPSPYEGDSVLSPSARLVASRLAGPDGKSHGYVIRRVAANRNGGSYTFNTSQELATVCMAGAKPSFSFDERFAVAHTYANGKADLLLLDLATHERVQITNMPEGSYAQFPHFRSDGWIYFLVVTPDSEYIAASDAAIRLAP